VIEGERDGACFMAGGDRERSSSCGRSSKTRRWTRQQSTTLAVRGRTLREAGGSLGKDIPLPVVSAAQTSLMQYRKRQSASATAVALLRDQLGKHPFEENGEQESR